MSDKSNLQKANEEKNDEFYTQLSDIEKELKNYKAHLENKVVLCNCDDPEESDFWKYFSLNFEFLGLKKLISTHLAGENSYKLEIVNGKTIKTSLKQNGDFRSPECIEILKEADIVVTNPPFSLFREYLAQLFEYDKKFIIMGNLNAITYSETFKLIKDNKIWLGQSIHGGDRAFRIPGPENKVKRIGVRWFVNLDYEDRHKDLMLYKTYLGHEDEYPKYDNYDAININVTKDIPMDYIGEMGVPITFLDKYNPDQFEIIGLGNGRENFSPNKDYVNTYLVMKSGKKKNGNTINRVLALESQTKPNGTYYMSEGKCLIAPYARIIIKNKKL